MQRRLWPARRGVIFARSDIATNLRPEIETDGTGPSDGALSLLRLPHRTG